MFKKFCALLIGLTLIFVSCAIAETSFVVGYTVTYRQTDARSMLDMINEFRTGDDAWYWNSDDTTKTYLTDLGELVYDYSLEKIAMQRAAEVALHTGHTRPDNTGWNTAHSVVNNSYMPRGENLAYGYYTSLQNAEAAFVCWCEEDKAYAGQGHRRNMLSSGYNAIGIAHVYYQGCHFWAQALGYSASPDTTPITANDSATAVTVAIDSALVSSFTLSGLSQSSLTIEYDETTALPAMTAELVMLNQWPSGWRDPDVVTVTPTWTSADSGCVTVSGSSATGWALGSTTLTASVGDSTAALPVTVSHSGLAGADYVLPDDLTIIAAEAFTGTPARAITIPGGVTSIGERAFANCTHLQNITIPASVTELSSTAFQSCSDGLIICCPENSAAAQFAQTYGFETVRVCE